jgi:outer membrane immunogenic protein
MFGANDQGEHPMKQLFITAMLSIAAAGGAFAADLPQPAPQPQAPVAYVPTVAPVYNWGGIYVGINGGYGFGTSSWSDSANPSGVTSSGDFSTNGGLIGGTVGANYQADAFVFGVEGDLDWQGLTGSNTGPFCTSVLGSGGTAAGLSCKTESDWLATFRGRVGYAADRVLFFGTAGGAAGNVQTALSGLSFSSNTSLGWTVGAGVEAAFADNWTAKIEYLYVDLGSANCNQATSCGFDFTGPAVAANDSVKFTENVIRVGVNYKFNP